MTQCCRCLCPGDQSLELRVGSHNRGHECVAAYYTTMMFKNKTVYGTTPCARYAVLDVITVAPRRPEDRGPIAQSWIERNIDAIRPCSK